MGPIQEKLLEIYAAVRKICDEHGLRYFAIGGTCLGAVRHKGFIPWDDDMDIAMPDEDFEQFMRIAPVELPEPLELIKIGQLAHGNFNPIAKVQNKDTTFIEALEMPFPDSYKGAFLDIMPFCGLRASRLEQRTEFALIKILSHCNNIQRSSFRQVRAFRHGAVKLAFKAVSVLFPANFYVMLWTKLIFRRKYDEEPFTCFLWSATPEGLVLDKAWYRDYVELPFENTTIRCPVDWDAYLKKHFGDYMRLPPPEMRVQHNSGYVDIDRPFRYYQEHGLPENIQRKD